MKKAVAIAQRLMAAVGTIISHHIDGFHIPFGLGLMETIESP